MVQRRAQPSFVRDNGATFFDTSSNGGALQTFQYRVGGRYFPAAPVQCSSTTGSAVSNGGAEAYIELSKALNIVGDYRLSTGVHTDRWSLVNSGGSLLEYDYTITGSTTASTGIVSPTIVTDLTNSFAGVQGSACFCAAVSLETSNGVEISGLNAEEQVRVEIFIIE